MNPSAIGWIKKLLKELEALETIKSSTLEKLYHNLRACGYIYGSNMSIINNYIPIDDFSPEEICKINHIIVLYTIHNETHPQESFIKNTIDFYSRVNAYKSSFLSDIFDEKNSPEFLEKIIHKRIQIDNNLIDKSFNYFITNALLFIDVIAFNHFLETGNVSEIDIQEKEAAIETIVLNTLNVKEGKTDYDNRLIDLFEQSLRYQQNKKLRYNEALSLLSNTLDKYYIIDLACMSTWSDKTIDEDEYHFLLLLGKDLQLEQQVVENAIKAINTFYTKYKRDIVILGSQNIVKSFYDNSSRMVSKLLSRNSKRLKKELSQSKELMVLITQSTVRDLTTEEQKKVQEQLLDIFKSIPSLAIFMLPGGALLLPLVIKFIPKLLPSGFDDNRIEE